MKNILGISAFYHDSAACLVIGGEIIAAAQEERFTRKKHTSNFPNHAIAYCLEEGGLTIDELDAVVFYDKPLLTFERLLQTYYAFAPKGLISFLKSIPIWFKEKLFLKKMIRDGLKEVEPYNVKKLNLLFTEHHLSHAASTFFASPFEKAAILTIDGVGEWATATISEGNLNNIELKKEMSFPHSVGLLYSAFTYFLGFKVNSGEYKLMGLAPYGNANDVQTKEFIEIIKTHLVSIKKDGSIWLDQSYFNYATGLRMIKDAKWKQLFNLKRRMPEDPMTQEHCNLAFAIQNVTEEIVLKMAAHAKAITNSDYLCMAGGVALNCVANGKLIATGLFKDVYIQPASGDSGGALGAALAIHHMYFNEKRITDSEQDRMKGAYLGPYFSEKEIQTMNRKMKATVVKIDRLDVLSETVAKYIAKGAIVGWFQDRMEFGPRALGNRSILADPSHPEMQEKLNLHIKYREGFRPFAPSVLAEDAQKYFNLEASSPYMTIVAPVKEIYRRELPKNYDKLSLDQKLNSPRSELQAITHLDFSARIQTVKKESNSAYWQLLQAVKKETGKGMLINTSFNVRGEPIVCSPTDAYYCFMNTEMDYLVIHNFVYTKTKQKDHKDKTKWTQQFKKD